MTETLGIWANNYISKIFIVNIIATYNPATMHSALRYRMSNWFKVRKIRDVYLGYLTDCHRDGRKCTLRTLVIRHRHQLLQISFRRMNLIVDEIDILHKLVVYVFMP